jgi:hypothetical protein
VAHDFQVSNSGSWEPLVLEPPWNPPLKNFWIRAWITVKNRSLLITGINSKVGHFRGNDSYKGSSNNFIQIKTFDELDLCIISARKSFSGSQEEDQNVSNNTCLVPHSEHPQS